MAQGKAWDKDKVLESLEDYFKLGYSRYKACMLANVDLSLLSKWEAKSPELSLKINAWIEWPNTLARRNWIAKLNDQEYIASKEWLERRDRDDFSTKQVTEHQGEIAIPILGGVSVQKDESNKQDTSAQEED